MRIQLLFQQVFLKNSAYILSADKLQLFLSAKVVHRRRNSGRKSSWLRTIYRIIVCIISLCITFKKDHFQLRYLVKLFVVWSGVRAHWPSCIYYLHGGLCSNPHSNIIVQGSSLGPQIYNRYTKYMKIHSSLTPNE